jgi:hypothetical protein
MSNTSTGNAKAENIYTAELVTDEPHRKTTILVLTMAILAIVVAAVVTGVCAAGKCGSNPMPATVRPMHPPTEIPSASPTSIIVFVEDVVSAFVNNISYLGQEIFINGTSAESQALAWIVDGDPLFADNRTALLTLHSEKVDEVTFRVRQRYSLMIL